MGNNGCCGGAEKSVENSCSTEKTGSCGTEKTGSCGSGKKHCCPGTILKGALVGGIVLFVYFWAAWTFCPWHKTGLPAGFTMTADMNGAMIKDFLFCLFGGALLTKVLKKRSECCCPVALSVIVGLLAGVFAYLPNMIWFNFPGAYTLEGIVDDVIAITLAGAAISCLVLKSGGGSCCCPMCKCLNSKGACGEKTGSCGDTKTSGSCGDKPAGSCGDKTGSCH